MRSLFPAVCQQDRLWFGPSGQRPLTKTLTNKDTRFDQFGLAEIFPADFAETLSHCWITHFLLTSHIVCVPYDKSRNLDNAGR